MEERCLLVRAHFEPYSVVFITLFFAKVDDVFDNGITIYNGRVFICGQIFLF